MKLINTVYGKLVQESFKSINGWDWEITTMKRNDGFISCIAQACVINEESKSRSVSFSVFSDPSITLFKLKANATEKNLIKVHSEGIIAFEDLKSKKTLPINKASKQYYEIKIGQILFLNGYGQCESSHDNLIVVEIDKTKSTYTTVNQTTLEISYKDIRHVRNIKDKFGIGIYFIEDDIIPENDAINLYLDAKNLKKEKDIKFQINKELETQLRNAKIEEGLKKVVIPDNFTAIIYAEFRNDISDSQTDYFAHKTTKIVYLAFSKNKKHSYNELRKAASNFEDTKHLSEYNKDFEKEYPSKSIGKHSRSGWHICINKYFTLDFLKEELAIAIEENRYFIPTEDKVINTTSNFDKSENITDSSKYQILQYNDKCFAIFGDTKQIKDKLKEFNCVFNYNLQHPVTKEKLPGWIFKKEKYESINQFINNIKHNI